MRARKSRAAASELIAIAGALDVEEIPNYVQLTPEEAAHWPIFASARLRGDWSKSDTLLIGKACQLEQEIRSSRAVLKETGMVIRQPNGNRTPNPLVAIIDTLQRQQLSILRGLSITSKPDGRTLAGRAARGRTIEHARADDEELLA